MVLRRVQLRPLQLCPAPSPVVSMHHPRAPQGHLTCPASKLRGGQAFGSGPVLDVRTGQPAFSELDLVGAACPHGRGGSMRPQEQWSWSSMSSGLGLQSQSSGDQGTVRASGFILPCGEAASGKGLETCSSSLASRTPCQDTRIPRPVEGGVCLFWKITWRAFVLAHSFA